MKNSIDRHRHFGTFRSPTPDEKGYQAVMDYIKKDIDNDPKKKKDLDNKWINRTKLTP